MAKNVKKRLKESYRAKTPRAKKRQTEGRKQRHKERLKTEKGFSIQECKKDIIQFSEKEIKNKPGVPSLTYNMQTFYQKGRKIGIKTSGLFLTPLKTQNFSFYFWLY